MAEKSELELLKEKVEVLEAKEAIRDVLARYAFTVDRCRYDNFMELWTDDGVFITDGPGTTVEKKGKQEIKAYLTDLLPAADAGTQHLQLDYVITVKGDTAKAIGYQLISISKTEPPSIARCALRTFTFKRINGNWLIEEAISRAINNDGACQELLKKG